MKVKELIGILKSIPEDLEVFGPSDDSDFDYQPVMKVFVEKSTLVDYDDYTEEPEPIDLCIISVRE